MYIRIKLRYTYVFPFQYDFHSIASVHIVIHYSIANIGSKVFHLLE